MAETLEIVQSEERLFLPSRVPGRRGPTAGNWIGPSARFERLREGSPVVGGA